MGQKKYIRLYGGGIAAWALSAIIIACAPLTHPISAAELSEDDCYEVSLATELEWPTSGFWTTSDAGQPILLVVDTLRNDFAGEVMEIAPDGAVSAAFGVESGMAFKSRTPVVRDMMPQVPTHLRADGLGDAVLLDDKEPSELVFIDQDLRMADPPFKLDKMLESKADDGKGSIQIEAIFDMVPIGTDGVLAFADVVVTTDGKPEYTSAFLYFDQKGRSQIFQRIDPMADVISQYTRNMPYMAVPLTSRRGHRSAGDVGFILRLDQKPTLAKVQYGSEIRELPDFPVDFQSRPRLVRQPEMWGPRQATVFYKTMELSTMAAGLYTWSGNLYLLGKNPAGENGTTAWWLLRLDPESGSELSRVRLPTDATNLTIIPGEHWALLQKDAVRGVGELHAPYMGTRSMVVVPDRWIAEPSAGRLDANLRVSCDTLNQ